MTSKITLSDNVPQSLPGIDLQKGIERWDGWQDYFLTLNTFARRRQTTAEEIARQINSGNRVAALELIHSIKGASGNLDLIQTYECARELEIALRDGDGDTEVPLQRFRDALAQVIDSISNLPSGKNIENIKSLVLIVDDDAISHRLLRKALEKKFRLISASDGREALELIDSQHPHVVLLDLGLPKMNGWVVLAEMKRRGISDIHKVIIVSAEEDGEMKARALNMGAREFLTKPIDAAELNARLEKVLTLRTDEEFSRDGRLQADIADQINIALETLIKDRNELYITAIDRLQASLHVKEEFLANMSHELRTPLNAILGFAALINDNIHGSIGNSKYQDYVRDIQSSGQHLLRLIEDILDVSVAADADFKLQEETVDMTALVSDCISGYMMMAEQNGIFLCGCSTTYLPNLMVDRSRVAQILNNLISNAIKYTPNDGRIVVSCDWSGKGSEDNRGFKITIADTGIGMDEEEILRARTPFGVNRNSKYAHHEGIGLGLTLAEHLMEAHDGLLGIESKVGEGTVITLSFPENRVIHAGAAD